MRSDLYPLLGQPGGPATIAAAAHDLVRTIIAEQEALGLDILSEGESTRSDYWSYFVAGLDGVTVERNGAVRVTGTLAPKSLDLVDDWKLAQSFTTLPVKVTIPGPITCARYVADEAYGSVEALSRAFAGIINHTVHQLAAEGCRYIQLDDCQLTYDPDAAARFGLEYTALCFDGIGPEISRVVHICLGTPGFVRQYEGTGKAPSSNCYPFLLSELDHMPVDVISVESAFSPLPPSTFAGLKTKTVMLGVVDVATTEVETVETIMERARPVVELLGRNRVILAPDCGFSAWNREADKAAYHAKALRKLANMVEAARRLNEA